GLGVRARADVVRVLWPSGVLQAETTTRSPMNIEELDRKPSSCPFLYAWNGERFQFVTDFMGGGEMGYWEAPGVRNTPDPDDFELSPFRGYAAMHTLTLTLPRGAGSTVLLLTGWTDYAFSSDNVAAHQAGLRMQPPRLEVRDAAGKWRTAIADIGIPVGRPQTIVVDLAKRI